MFQAVPSRGQPETRLHDVTTMTFSEASGRYPNLSTLRSDAYQRMVCYEIEGHDTRTLP